MRPRLQVKLLPNSLRKALGPLVAGVRSHDILDGVSVHELGIAAYVVEDGRQLDQGANGRQRARLAQVLVPHDGLGHALGLRQRPALLLHHAQRDHPAVELEAHPRRRDVLVRCADVV